MNSIHLHEPMLPREKRLKVSKACFTCRVKKIKCDGLQPCMQCKARKRPCSFSKDGTVDQTQQLSDIHQHHTTEEEDYDTNNKRPHSPPPQQTNNNNNNTSRLREQDELRTSSQQLDKLSMMWPGEGKEGRWLVDINLLFNGSFPVEEQQNIVVVPPLHINTNLISLFFRHRYAIFPILPKSIFYRLLEHRDPLINSLLLYSMYCNAAHFSHEDASEADQYYKKAQVLLDTCIDTPSLGTVISLCLLSTFESNRYYGDIIGSRSHATTNRSRIYSDMAFRMCFGLKLHQRYSGGGIHTTLDDNELRKRVYWACYCLDKISSLVTGRPCLLTSKEIDIDFPMVLQSDDNHEYEINTCFVEHIKLMQIAERVIDNNNNKYKIGMIRSPENEQLVLDLDQQLLFWLRNIPQKLQWIPLDTNGDMMVPTEPPTNALVAHLHLIYNYVEISVLQPLASTNLSSSHASLLIQKRCASVATNLTQLTCAMADQPDFIMSFTLVSEAIMSAVRVHIMDCADEKLNTARHARFMFQRSLRSLRSILHHRIIDGIQEFTTTIERALQDADTGNSSSRNSSPKIHVLSPVIPRTTSSPPISGNASLDEKWATTTARFNHHNTALYPYGLISPASSTASAPVVEKSSNGVVSRDEESIRPSSIMNTSSSFRNTIPQSSSTPWKSLQQKQQQQMEIYSNIWSKPSTVFPNSNHHHHLDYEQQTHSTTTTTPLSTSTTTSATMNPDVELYSLWDHQTTEKNTLKKEKQEPILFTPQVGRYGLGVYASAQQHHTDVIRQHMPGMKSSNLNRPVLLNHHGQVVVAAPRNN